MSTRRRVLFGLSKAGRIVAFVGCLVSALLPLGQMPKVAGPCGRELCECAPVRTTPCSGKENCPFRAPEARLVFAGPVFSASAPATILITAVSDFKAPQPVEAPVFAVEVINRCAPHADLFALTSVTHDIATPPPRA